MPTIKNMSSREFFDESEKQAIVGAIKRAENQTSGEIRLYIDDHCKEDVLDKAAFVFDKLEMQRTRERNGVLFYLAVKDQKFAILGDAGINAKVPENFWDDVKTTIYKDFVLGNFSAGLIQGIEIAGEKLKDFFPVRDDDENELPDDIYIADD